MNDSDENDPVHAEVEAADALLDEKLAAHFRTELDPHLGRACAKFVALTAPQPRRLLHAVRWSAAAVLLVGFGIAIAVMKSGVDRPKAAPAVAKTMAAAPTDAIFTSWTETYDDGTVLVDPQTPARMLRRVEYEKAEWKDASGQWRSTVTTPRQDVILLDLQKQ